MPRKISAILVDDEQNAILNLKKLITTYCPNVDVVNTANDGETAIHIINNLRPDVVFLDIAMPNKNGFEVLNQLNYMPLIVFVTAYEKYALNAIKASAVDFLLKPIDINELKKVEDKLLNIIQVLETNNIENYKSVIGNLISMLSYPGNIKTITLHNTEGYNIIEVNEILYLEGDNNYTSFFLSHSRKIVVSKTLKEYESLLHDIGFIRIHKSSIINPAHLKRINKENGLQVVMIDERCLNVSRRRSTELIEKTKKLFL